MSRCSCRSASRGWKKNELGEGKLISGLEWNEDAKKISIDELFVRP